MASQSADRGSSFQPQPDAIKDDADSNEIWNIPAEGTADNFPSSNLSTAIVPVVGDNCDVARPSDDEILIQQNIIRAETELRPFIGAVEALQELKAEYENGSKVFVKKIESLSHQYGSMRRTRGDGNCFFRSFIFSYLEGILARGDLAERDAFIQRIQQWKQKLIDIGFQELVFEDAMDLLLNQVQAIGSAQSPVTLEVLESNFCDDTISNMVVMLLRMITSAEIQRRQDHFCPFILGAHDDVADIMQFCRRYVEVMGEESDHVHIVALTDALLVPTRVVYLDNSTYPGASGGNLEVTTHDFTPEGLQVQGNSTHVYVLYRPGHYDILYPLSAAPL